MVAEKSDAGKACGDKKAEKEEKHICLNPAYEFLNETKSFSSRHSRLEQQAEVSRKMVRLTSHDLMSPINAITGYLDLMKYSLDAGVDPDKLSHYRMQIKNGITDLSAIVQQLKALANVEEEEELTLACEIEVNWVVRQICEVMEGAAMAKEHDIIGTFSPMPAFVHADIGQLKRIVYNLIDNAIKYTPRGGRIHVMVKSLDNHVMVIVDDTGIGIPPEKQREIFKPFNKLEQAGTEMEPSTGLGLYICNHFARIMNGRISVDSEVGNGSSFTLILPAV
jgi:signal transduction histidine kinase